MYCSVCTTTCNIEILEGWNRSHLEVEFAQHYRAWPDDLDLGNVDILSATLFVGGHGVTLDLRQSRDYQAVESALRYWLSVSDNAKQTVELACSRDAESGSEVAP